MKNVKKFAVAKISFESKARGNLVARFSTSVQKSEIWVRDWVPISYIKIRVLVLRMSTLKVKNQKVLYM